MVALTVVIFLFEIAMDYLKWTNKAVAWGGLVVLILIFNFVWEKIHSDVDNTETNRQNDI